jgi:hypothetical protein
MILKLFFSLYYCFIGHLLFRLLPLPYNNFFERIGDNHTSTLFSLSCILPFSCFGKSSELFRRNKNFFSFVRFLHGTQLWFRFFFSRFRCHHLLAHLSSQEFHQVVFKWISDSRTYEITFIKGISVE